MWDLVGNPEDRFSHNEAKIVQREAIKYTKNVLLSAQNVYWQFPFRNQFIALRERLRTYKVFTKDQCFYLNHHKFSIKSFVLDMY